MHRQAGKKITDYTNEIKKVASLKTVQSIYQQLLTRRVGTLCLDMIDAYQVQDFWGLYTRLKRPGELQNVSDYHFFKKDIRPTWEVDLA